MKTSKRKPAQPFIAALLGIAAGLVIMLLGCGGAAAWIGSGRISEQWMQPIALLISALGFYTGCLIAAEKTEKLRLPMSGAAAGGLLVILVVVQQLLFDTTASMPVVTLVVALVMSVAGALTAEQMRRKSGHR